MIYRLLLSSALLFTSHLALSFEPPANSQLIVEEDFAGSGLPEKWTVQNGAWSSADGVLTAAEIAEDNHAASARRVVETGDAVYQLKFKLSEGTKAFHFGFDPIRGALDKKGHLFSVIVMPEEWRIIKHVDKNKPKEDPNEILATTDQSFTPGQWYHLRVTTWGTTVKAIIEGIEPLTASHPTFSVRKPTLVFRVSGGAVEVDELRVWEPKE